jgi:glycosyltransferase involved in cell wall biosynthesis
MNAPILSITIPTYNRLARLSATLATVLPQLRDDVELLVSDNCSSDGTWDYLQQLPSSVRSMRQWQNVGAERNILQCLSNARGQYVWLLCDDDIPSADAVGEILSGIVEYREPPLIYLRSSLASACRLPNPDNRFWLEETGDQFLTDIASWITFCSSIVVRRDCVDWGYLTRYVESCLLPAALTLSILAKHDCAVVSSQAVLSPKVGERGAYDAVGIFGGNLRKLLRQCQKQGWFGAESLKALYEDNLRHVVASYLRSDWPLRPRSVVRMIAYSADCRPLYSTLLPLLFGRIYSNARAGVGRVVTRIRLLVASRGS